MHVLDQLAKPTFRSRYPHPPFTEHTEGPMDTVSPMHVYNVCIYLYVFLCDNIAMLLCLIRFKIFDNAH